MSISQHFPTDCTLNWLHLPSSHLTQTQLESSVHLAQTWQGNFDIFSFFNDINFSSTSKSSQLLAQEDVLAQELFQDKPQLESNADCLLSNNGWQCLWPTFQLLSLSFPLLNLYKLCLSHEEQTTEALKIHVSKH